MCGLFLLNDYTGAPVIGVEILIMGDVGCGPPIYPLGSSRAHIDAAMAVRYTKVIVPVSAMKGNPVIREIAYPGHAGYT